MSRRIVIATLGIAILAALVFAYVYRAQSTSDHKKIVIAQAGDFFLYAPLYIALDRGFFAESGLDVSITTTGGDDKTWAAVTSGSASFGIADPTFVVISAQRGQPGRVIANIVNGVPFWAITFRKDLKPISDPAQLKGLVIGTFPSPSTAYTLQAKMFRDAELQPTIREGAFGAMLPMLRANQADAVLELEPNVSLAVAEGATVLYSLKEVYGEFAITGLTATPELLLKDPELAHRTVCAFQKALDFLNEEPALAQQLLAKRFPDLPADIARAAMQRVIPEGIIPKSAVTTPVAWEHAASLRRETGDITGPATHQEFVDNTYSTAALSKCRYQKSPQN